MANEEKDKSQNKSGAQPPPGPDPAPKPIRRVEVLVDNLSPKLYQKGEIVADPDIVELLDTQEDRNLVREV